MALRFGTRRTQWGRGGKTRLWTGIKHSHISMFFAQGSDQTQEPQKGWRCWLSFRPWWISGTRKRQSSACKLQQTSSRAWELLLHFCTSRVLIPSSEQLEPRTRLVCPLVSKAVAVTAFYAAAVLSKTRATSN